MQKEKLIKPLRSLSGKKNKQQRETVGSIALKLKNQYKADDVAPVSDIGADTNKSFMDDVWVTVDRGKQEHKVPFFVVVLHRKEKLLPNVIRNQFHYRLSCPTPTYLQTVFRYHPQDDELEYYWSLPTKNRCFYMYNQKEFVPPEEYQLLSFVIDFIEGRLDKMAQSLNNETIPDPLAVIF